MPKLIITSVGTSFTLIDETRNPFEGIEDKRLDELIDNRNRFWETVETNNGYQEGVDAWKPNIVGNLERSLNTAELKSLQAIFQTQIGNPPGPLASIENDYILLLASNTYLGSYGADVTEQVVKAKVISNSNIDARVWKTVVPKLNFNPDSEGSRSVDKNFFKRLAKNFTDTVDEAIAEFQRRCEAASEEAGEVIFNITGGFKGSVPFLSWIADQKKTRMVYLFEGTEQLIVINFAAMLSNGPSGAISQSLEDHIES